MTWSPVLTKGDFVRRYVLGEFGNASPTYQNVVALNNQGSGFRKYHLRNRIAGGETYYDLDFFQAISKWSEVREPGQWYVSEMAPTEKTILQGEVMRIETGLYLLFSHVAKPMRDALRESSQSLRGLAAVMLLRGHLCANSLEWLGVLLDRYPDHVIEFSAYSANWGTLPHYNTVFWEVRKY